MVGSGSLGFNGCRTGCYEPAVAIVTVVSILMRCHGCDQEKPRSEMVGDNGRAERNDWHVGECKACKLQRQRKTYDPARHRNHQLMHRYGIGAVEYDALLFAQGGGCAICHSPPKGRFLHVDHDHDHDSGIVRGLLCARCNSAIEWSLLWADEARTYVERAVMSSRVRN